MIESEEIKLICYNKNEFRAKIGKNIFNQSNEPEINTKEMGRIFYNKEKNDVQCREEKNQFNQSNETESNPYVKQK